MRLNHKASKPTDRMATLTSVLYWYDRWLADDTVLALRMLALTGDALPELAELLDCLDRVEVLLSVYRQRLEGAEVIQLDGEYLCIPLPEL